MTIIMARRLGIICLIAALFSMGLLAVVENHRPQPHVGQFQLAAPCPQPQGVQCRVRT